MRNAGIKPHAIDYLKCPPSRALLKTLIARMGVAVRDAKKRSFEDV
jgi:arsenate reductase-like glutaredoxin family protein